MAKIEISEISQNYSYNINSAAYATVAMPITASWGPAYVDAESAGLTKEELLENVRWQRFPATQAGLESFVSTYRGATSNYRVAKDYSYQMAMTLIAAGYDVLVCRVCPGGRATGVFTESGNKLHVTAKYPGSFGNNLLVTLTKVPNRDFWNLITYVVDASGVRTAVENIVFVFDIEHSTDTILHIDEIESNFLDFQVEGTLSDATNFSAASVTLTGGSDKAENKGTSDMIADAVKYATHRYSEAGYETPSKLDYIKALEGCKSTIKDVTKASVIKYLEWLYTSAFEVLDLLKDKLSYNPNRVITSGWDDQNILALTDTPVKNLTAISPLHIKLLDVCYHSRCATGYIDVPKSLPRSAVYNEDSTSSEANLGYAQRLSRFLPPNVNNSVNRNLYSSHCALFAPWGQYKFAGTGKQNEAAPSFLALMIQRSMILNQSIQYEWALPTNRKHDLRIGRMKYNVPKKFLDIWQKLDGVGINAITEIPGLGTSLWGNSTLYEVPPATYQALANLSTRLLVNAVEDQAYKCGLGITFKYNNAEAYDAFYAGVTPLLDTMKNVGAIEGYKVTMAADINGLDKVNVNTVVGKIYLNIHGVINDIYIDLVALPPGSNLDLI